MLQREALKERMTIASQEIDSVVIGKVFDEIQYHRFSVKYGTLFEARIGAEAIYDLFRNLKMDELKKMLEERYAEPLELLIAKSLRSVSRSSRA